MDDFLTTMQSFCENLLQQQQVANIDHPPLQEMSLKEIKDLKHHYLDEMLSLSNDLGIKDFHNEKIDIRFRRECEDTIHELKGKFNGISIKINKRRERQYLEQVANLSAISSQRFNSFCYDDDDDYDYKESAIPLNDIISPGPPSNVITTSPLILPIKDPEDSHIMGNEELNTIPEKESDEFIKSSVEDLELNTIPEKESDEFIKSSVEDLDLIPSESKDTSGSASVCILPSCDDFSPIDVPEEKATFLVTPLSDSNEDEYFTPSDDVELLLYHDLSMSVASILKGFIDESPLEKNDELFDLEPKNDDWKKILYDAPILITEDKVFDLGIHDQKFSPTYVSLPFTDLHYIFFTYVVRIFLPHFIYPVESPYLISSKSEDTIFYPGNGYVKKWIKSKQNIQNRAREWKEPLIGGLDVGLDPRVEKIDWGIRANEGSRWEDEGASRGLEASPHSYKRRPHLTEQSI
nr:hypothetical protein [Tanacetum cinerariifolium]